MPESKVFRGDAPAIAQVTRITPPETSGAVTLSISNKRFEFAAWDVEEIVATWNGETETVDPVSQTEEISAVEASADGDDLILTAREPGVPFIVVVGAGTGAAVNEVQTVTIGNSPTGGTFTLTYSAQTTGGIAYNATAAAVQAALEALSNIAPGDVAVMGPAGGPWQIEFAGTLGGIDVALMTASAASLTGGTSAVTITTLQQGQTGVNAEQRVTLNGGPTGGTFTLTFNGQTTGNIAYNASAATVDTALEALSNIAPGDVTVTGSAGGPWDIEFTGNLAALPMPLITADAGDLTGSDLDVLISTITNGAAGLNYILKWTFSETFPGGFKAGYPGEDGYFINGYDGVDVFGDIDTDELFSGADNQATKLRDLIQALGNVGTGNVTVTWDGTGYVIEFVNARKTQLVFVGCAHWVPPDYATTDFVPEGSLIQFPDAGANEVQDVVLDGSPTAGTFSLTYSGQTTAPIAFDATADDVKDALEALSNIPTGALLATGGPLPDTPVEIEFADEGLQATNLSEMTGSVAEMGAVVDELVVGLAGLPETQTITLTNSPTGGTFTLTLDGQTTAAIARNANAAAVQSAIEALSNVDPGEVVCSGGPLPATVTCVFDDTLGNLPQMTAAATLHNGTVTVAQVVAGGGVFVIEVTRSEGPNHYDAPGNWDPEGVPSTGDTVDLQGGDTDILYGIKQRDTFTVDATADTLRLTSGRQLFLDGQVVRVRSSVTLPAGLAAGTDYHVVRAAYGGDALLQLSATAGGSAVNITNAGSGTHTIEVVLAVLRSHARWGGDVGLPRQPQGAYEYLPQYLELGATSVEIGVGTGSGGGLFKLDTGPLQTTLRIFDTGGSNSPGERAVEWKGTHASNTLEMLAGDVGVSLFSDETAELSEIKQRGGELELGPGCTVTGPIDKTGGILLAQQATIDGPLLLRG